MNGAYVSPREENPAYCQRSTPRELILLFGDIMQYGACRWEDQTSDRVWEQEAVRQEWHMSPLYAYASLDSISNSEMTLHIAPDPPSLQTPS